MKNSYNNSFSIFKLPTNLEEAFSIKRNQGSNFYSVIWVTEGMIDLSVDGVVIPLNTNQMAFVTPTKFIKILENHGKSSIIQFNREFYCIRENDHEVSCEGILFFGAQGIPIVDLDAKEVQSFCGMFDELKNEFEIVDSIQEEMLRTNLKKLLIRSTRILKRQNNFTSADECKVELLRQFQIEVEKNFKKNHKVSFYAQLLKKSPKTIANQFKILGQECPSKIIQQRIIVEAKRYLLYSNLSIKEIAFNLGFDHAPAFSHYFKAVTGVSPSHFKTTHREKQ